ncbi:MAG TPA: hypothetical protein VGJ07_18285 [Rugosimonospora sp.]|jgi:hypothetical protein
MSISEHEPRRSGDSRRLEVGWSSADAALASAALAGAAGDLVGSFGAPVRSFHKSR